MGLETLFFGAVAAFKAFSATAFGSFVVKTLGGLGLALGLSALSTKKQKQGAQSPASGSQLDLATGGDVVRSVVFYRAPTEGHLVWRKTTGDNNQFLHMNIVYSDGWCAPPEGVIIDGVRKNLIAQTVIGTEHARYHVEDFGSDIIVRWHDGRPGQAADSDMIAISGGEIRTQDVGEGLAYFSVTVALSREGISNVPTMLWLGGGYRCYDLRKDSTAGGAGDHRLDDPATWEPSGNNFVQSYNYAIGIRAGSDTKALGGFADLDGLIDATFMVAGNIADEIITSDGVLEKRYECSIIVYADGEDHRGKMAGFLQAGAGWAIERGGQLGVLAGAAQTPVVTITDDDLVPGEDVEWWRDKPRDERANEVNGKFTSPDNLFEPDSYPTVQNAAARAADGELLDAVLDLLQVQSPTQAQRNASIRLEESRLGGASVPLPETFMLVELGDWVRWNSARYGDYLYRVDDFEDNDNGVLRFGLQRTNAGVYGEPSFQTYTPVPTPTLPAPGISTISGLTLTANQITGAGGALKSVLDVSWTPPGDLEIDAVLLQYRQVGSIAAQPYRVEDVESGATRITDIVGGADYEVRATITTTPARRTTWTPWQSITTSDDVVAIPDASVSLASLAADHQSLLATIQRVQGQLEQVVAANGMNGALQALETFVEDGRIELLASQVGEESKALVLEETSARTSAIEAAANKSILVQSSLDGATSTALLAAETSVSGDGLTTSFSFFARASDADDFEEAGMVISVISDGGSPATFTSKVEFSADSLFFDDGSQPFSVVDGEVRLNVGRAKKIESYPGNPKGNLKIDFENVEISLDSPPAP